MAGAWLGARGIDPDTVVDLGFLVPSGWEGDDLIDDEDTMGPVVADVLERPDGADLRTAIGQDASSGAGTAYRVYRVRQEWVAEHLLEQIVTALDSPAVAEIGPNLFSPGTMTIGERDVPIYLARRLADERSRTAIDTELRARSDLGTELVLHAAEMGDRCFATNVLTPVLDHLDRSASKLSLNVDSMKAAFERSRGLAKGGEAVELIRGGETDGTLSIPGSGTISISGANRLAVIERLVDAYRSGNPIVAT